ncbi:hypothetical protein BGW80DRAFT_286979 [Lactifluus volemus]|nr:hypothetical protein BGW80DRAFT_286979 [Lactifluus volemus]
MSTFAVLTTLSLFSGHVLAQVYWASCTVPSFGWTYNSIEQNPCTVAAFLLSTCNGGYNIQPLPQGYSYAGPTAGTSDTCKCSTVAYSLLSACDACQGSTWFNWYDYSTNCTTDYPASSFPNPVPNGIRVPQWALIDITVQGTWNSSQSFAVGDLPEVLDGQKFNSSTSTSTHSVVPSSIVTASTSSSISSSQLTDTATSSSQTTGTVTSSSPPSSAGSSSNVGAIAGGVAGGLVAASAAALILFFLLRRRTAQQALPTAVVYGGTPQPLMGQVQSPPADDGAFMPPSLPTTPTTPIRLYDPNDPTTFPGYQGTFPTPAAEVYTEVPNMYIGSTVASTQPSRPQGYHGLPTV